mgnify:CR=1 FL=1
MEKKKYEKYRLGSLSECLEERAVLLGDRLHDLPGGRIARNAAQRRRADIQSDELHEIHLSTGRSTAGRAAG